MTFRGFDTYADAKTFAKFIESIGYTGIMISSFDEKTKLYKVFFDEMAV